MILKKQDLHEHEVSLNISVLILTFNEEINILRCLSSVAWSDDILVFDSGSTDRTAMLAQSKGANVLTRKFDNYGSQRQAALQQYHFKHTWLLILDADECVDETLAEEMQAISTEVTCPFSGFRIRRKDYFLDRWIPRATLYPTYFLRFFKHAQARYESRLVHEHPMVDGAVGNLKGHILHFPFNKGLGSWIEKHRNYAQLEAQEGFKISKQRIDWKNLLNPDPFQRRRFLKSLSYRVPIRRTARLFYMFLIRLTFLDGWPGIKYTLMISQYEGWIQEEFKRLQKHSSSLNQATSNFMKK
jgi:glycosyltransferase involved in cell wall biosynthesis